jgi:hypothetical protein
MLELLSWLEGSALGETLRASGVWTYGVLNLGHITGIATLFGAVLLLDLRLVGLWSDIRHDRAPGRPARNRRVLACGCNGRLHGDCQRHGLLRQSVSVDQVSGDRAWIAQRFSCQPHAGLAQPGRARAVATRTVQARDRGRVFAALLECGARGGSHDRVLVVGGAKPCSAAYRAPRADHMPVPGCPRSGIEARRCLVAA